MLSRIYSAPGGTEALDVLMKYMCDPISQAVQEAAIPTRGPADMSNYSYKGMALAAPASSARNITPQATGFSQVHSRGGGEGGGQAMSVLLSWHEKVRYLLHTPALRVPLGHDFASITSTASVLSC